MIPAWILDAFAAIMLAVAAVSAARLVAARAWSQPAADADIDVAHVLMGIAMAGMLTGALRTLPNAAWAAIFAVVTVWFGRRVAAEAARRRISDLSASHHLPHLVHGAAMVYMFLAVTGSQTAATPAMDGMGAAGASMGTLRVPALALAFVVFMAGWAVWDVDRLSGSSVSGSGGRARLGFALPGLRRPLALATAVSGQPGPGSAASLAHLTSSAADPGVAANAGTSGDASKPAAAASGGPAPVLTHLMDSRITIGCRIAMSVTMALMLVLMI